MPVLIVGSGVVGSQVARLEVERGERPVILEVSPQPEALAEIVDLTQVKLVQGDILNPLDLARVIQEEGVSHIIHTAANPMLTEGAQRNPYPAVVLNITGTLNVLEAARIFGVQRVVFCSSAVLYSSMARGEDEGSPNKEDAHPRPMTFYATTKQAGENLGFNYALQFGLDFRAVRFAAVFGPWQGRGGGGGPTQRFRALVERSIRGDEATFPATQRPTEFVYSKDAALGASLACHEEGLKSMVFNIGMGSVYTGQDVVAALRRVLPEANIQLQEAGLVAPSGSEGTLTVQPAATAPPMDASRSREELGYQRQYDMEAALRNYVQYYRALSE